MSKLAIITVAVILLAVSSPVLLRQRTVPLVSDGKVVAVAKRPFVMPWSDNEFPVYAEVQEVSSNLMSLTPSQVDAVSFPWLDLGIYRRYTPVEFLLRQLQTNRHSCWPLN